MAAVLLAGVAAVAAFTSADKWVLSLLVIGVGVVCAYIERPDEPGELPPS